jgi:signal transduction histidine kinase
MRRILNAMRPQVEIILDIQGTTDWYYSTQPGAVRRIVMNLFGNSLKYTKHGNITVSLRTSHIRRTADQSGKSAEERPSVIKICVRDTGQGISPEYLRTKIFTPFSQENAKVSAGTGLGLSIVKAIVNLLHGEIDIKSIVNVGTVVSVTLRKSLDEGLYSLLMLPNSDEEDNVWHLTRPNCQPSVQSSHHGPLHQRLCHF